MPKLTTCPDCGSEVSKSAKACPKCGRPLGRQPTRFGCGGWLLILGAAVFVVVAVSRKPDAGRPTQPAPAAPPAPRPTPLIGEHATLELPGGSGVFLAADDTSWNEMLDAQNAGSGELMGRLIGQGKVVREPNGSKVVVVRSGVASRFVRVTEGANVGFEGWIQAEYLRR